MPRMMIIDTDTASDDAVALIMALRHPDVRVLAITTVAGNMDLQQATRNALYTVERVGADVPVYAGADRPLLRPHVDARWFHGNDGMGDQGYPPAQRAAEAMHAVDALIAAIHAHPGVTLVTLGPLTNIALALCKAPDIAQQVGRCVVMGGAANVVGNVTPAAEYNIWCDPEAAQIVFQSGMPIEMLGWETGRGAAALTPDEVAYIRGFNTPLAEFAMDCNAHVVTAYARQTGETSMALHDPTAMAVALDPTICTRISRHRIMVETVSDLTRGQTVIDENNIHDDPRNRAVWAASHEVAVCWSLDPVRWKHMLYDALR